MKHISCVMMQRNRLGFVRPRRDFNRWMQNDAHKTAAAVGFLDHRSDRFVPVREHDDACARAEMKIPKLVAGRDGRNEQVLGTPSGRVAAEAGIVIDLQQMVEHVARNTARWPPLSRSKTTWPAEWPGAGMISMKSLRRCGLVTRSARLDRRQHAFAEVAELRRLLVRVGVELVVIVEIGLRKHLSRIGECRHPAAVALKCIPPDVVAMQGPPAAG
jgi:hypothetical protein